MSRCQVVPFCLMALLTSPLACSAQLNSHRDPRGVPTSNPSSAITSVHELQVPKKARDACNNGTRRLAAKDLAGSISEFQKAIKAFPGYYEAYAKLGAAELDLDQWDAAESAFRKAIELSEGRYPPANFGLGLILATVTKQFVEAEGIVRSGLTLSPTDVTGHFVLAWVLYSTGRLKEAEENARETILLAPGFGRAKLLLAQIHLGENRFSAVIADLDSYLALGRTSSLDDQVRSIRAEALEALPKEQTDSEIAEATK
jgi:tetratricopeptide (TPR) repeat protein